MMLILLQDVKKLIKDNVDINNDNNNNNNNSNNNIK